MKNEKHLQLKIIKSYRKSLPRPTHSMKDKKVYDRKDKSWKVPE